MTAYYNEIDPFAAAWLRELIKAGMIAGGEVDERSIEDVLPNDLMGFTQCHFFAGIGGWSYALRQAGWQDDRPVWTGSCPCQPFSQAGKGAGFADERHLWPSFFHIISQRRPTIIFGEQVASKAVEPWVDLVQADLEAVGYAFGCVPFTAASVGAPHIRDRAYWVANRCGSGLEIVGEQPAREKLQAAERGGEVGRLANSISARHRWGCGSQGPGVWDAAERHGCAINAWGKSTLIPCRDGKWRPVEPGTFPLAHGVPARVGRLRGYGNAIVTPQAQAFIESVMEVIG